ncbi:aminotransferase class V-fold PLP-dependent enzyme [Streptomyces sp. MS1.AVA.3]|uniref:aminotransferase class V-fold PLP-dependent enzyme n=1 Tax=Streptomyces decoyicus TaxID=249567 RepID=UPI0030C14F09
MTAPEGGQAALRKAARRARRLDARDPLAPFVGRFAPAADGRLFLDSSSLGRLPAATPELLDRVVRGDWGDRPAQGRAPWRDLPQRIGDRMAAAVLGARPGEVVAADCTSVNLYKLTVAALDARRGRRTVVVDDDNSPTDRYVVAGVAAERERALRTVHTHPETGLDMETLRAAVDEDVAVVVLSLVSHRSGALLDMAEVHEIAHAQGALVPALAGAGLFVDHLPPDRVRLSPGPLSTRFADVLEAVCRFREVLSGSGPGGWGV